MGCYRCKKCHKTFTKKYNLERHTQRAHRESCTKHYTECSDTDCEKHINEEKNQYTDEESDSRDEESSEGDQNTSEEDRDDVTSEEDVSTEESTSSEVGDDVSSNIRDRENNTVYDVVETWMTMVELNEAMATVLRRGLERKYLGKVKSNYRVKPY